MEIVGGFMVMMSILGMFLAVIWLIMPFVVIAMKGKQDRSLEVLELIEKRLTAMEQQISRLKQPPLHSGASPVIGEGTAHDPSRTPVHEVLPLA